MRWFRKDDKFYFGPVSDHEIDMVNRNRVIGHMAGVACTAGSGRVETYITFPITDVTAEMVRNGNVVPTEAITA